MPQRRIHQRLPYRSGQPRDFSSRYEDNRLNLSPAAEPQQVEQRRVRKHKPATRSERPWRQQPALGRPEREDGQWHVDENEEEETDEKGRQGTERQEHKQSSRRNRYRSPTESSKRSVRAQAGHTSARGASDSSLDSTRSARRTSLQEMPDVSAVRDLRKKFLAASFTSKGTKLHDLFKRFDRTHSGGLSFDEFSRAVRVDGRTPEWKMDEGMLRALWSTLGARPHDEISVAQCADFFEQEWPPPQPESHHQNILDPKMNPELKPELEPELGPDHSDPELQLNSARSSSSRRPGGGFRKPSAQTNPIRVVSMESNGSEDSYNEYGRQRVRTAREQVSLDADAKLGNLYLSDSCQSEQNSSHHSRRHHRAQRGARRQVYSPLDQHTLGEADGTAPALNSSHSFTGEDESDSDRSRERSMWTAPHDAGNADESLEPRQEQQADTEDQHDEEDEGSDDAEVRDEAAGGTPRLNDILDQDHRGDKEEGEEVEEEERSLESRPQVHEGGGTAAWRRKVVLMEREHAEHVAELQRQHLAVLEATVKEGQEQTAAVSRAHAKQVLQEEIARAIADPQTRQLVLGLQPQQHREQQQQEHGTVSPGQHEHLGAGEQVDVDDFLSPTARHELKQAWDAVDKNGDGYLERDELRAVFDQVGPTYTHEQWQQAFAQIDVNGSGRVNFGAHRLLCFMKLWASMPIACSYCL